MRWVAWVVLGLMGCAPVEGQEAVDLGLFTSTTLADPRDEALAALSRDARQREERFLEAADPGRLLRLSRPDEAAIADGRYPAATLFAVGAQLFHHAFTEGEGLGGRDARFPQRVQRGFRGGPEARACADCHGRAGPAGAGDAADNAYLQGDGQAPASALARNAPSLLGAGWVERLAAEMSDDLATQRAGWIREARRTRTVVRGALRTHGVDFGALTVSANGEVDTSEVEGVSADLVVRPFGRKGTFATLREVVDDELSTHHGLQSTHLVTDSDALPARLGPFGGEDPDGDGVVDEIVEGQVTAIAVYLALQPVPVVELPNTALVAPDAWAIGRARFEALGCGACHRLTLTAEGSADVLRSRVGGGAFAIDLLTSGASPTLVPDAQTGVLQVALLSDLKRHDLGDALADPRDDRGVDARLFLTAPLWGVASSGPYLHDGRAPTLHDAILAHEGEARAARDAYDALGEAGQAPVRVFLTSLTRAPVLVAR